MKVWWCEEHNSEKYPVKAIPARCFKVLVLGNWKIDPPCRMVEMQLVPADPCSVCGAWWERLHALNCSIHPGMESDNPFYAAEPPKDPWAYEP